MTWRYATLLLVVGCSSAHVQRASDPSTPSYDARPDSEELAYDRKEWRHWVDADHDCQDTRQEVLIAESERPVEFADERHCRVKRGRWTCPYTGRVVVDPAELDVDHLVPLENANASGDGRWTAARKAEYANYLNKPEHLIAVVASANRSKGSRGQSCGSRRMRPSAASTFVAGCRSRNGGG